MFRARSAPRPPGGRESERSTTRSTPPGVLMGNLGKVDGKEALERPEPKGDDRALLAGETLARWLDDRFLDPLLGLFLPGVGDLLGSALGLYPVLLAWKRRAPKALIARAVLGPAAAAVGGAVPVHGGILGILLKGPPPHRGLLRAPPAGAAFPC